MKNVGVGLIVSIAQIHNLLCLVLTSLDFSGAV